MTHFLQENEAGNGMTWPERALQAAKAGDLPRYKRMAERAAYARLTVDLQPAALLAIEGGNPDLVLFIVRQMRDGDRAWNLMAATALTAGQIHIFRVLVAESGGAADDWDWFAKSAAGFGAWPYFWEVVRLGEGKARRWRHFVKEAKATGHHQLAKDIRRHSWIFGWMGRLQRRWMRP